MEIDLQFGPWRYPREARSVGQQAEADLKLSGDTFGPPKDCQ
jgi:hypothetical protein